MKHLLLTTIAAVVLVACGQSQQSAPAPDISIHEAAGTGNIKAVKQHLADGAGVNAKDIDGWTPLRFAAEQGHNETA
jgi:ankyrin repeat protein